MNRKTSNEKMANGQQSQDIQNAPAIKVQITVHGNSDPGIFPAMLPPFAAMQGTDGCTNTIRGHHIGKAPPGRARAPGRARGHPPANKAGPSARKADKPDQTIQKTVASLLSLKRDGPGVSLKTIFQINNQIVNTKTILNFINNLNFKIMKKQILILALFVMAMFAGVTNSYAACQEDALHPIAGKPYSYTVSVTGFTEVSYQWFVTTNPAILTGGVFVTPLTATGNYNISGETTSTATITWTPELIADALKTTGGNNYYVVVKYVGLDAAGNCNESNIKAYKILPANQFMLDIANVDASNALQADGFTTCTSDAVSALITDNGTTATIATNYGSNDIFVKVTVTNFTGAWNLNVNRAAIIAGLTSGESAKLYWGTSIAAATTEITGDDVSSIAEQNIADATTPEVIYLKLTVAHGTNEGLTLENFAFSVNATDKAGNPDVSLACIAETDGVTQKISARPTIVDGTEVGTYLMP